MTVINDIKPLSGCGGNTGTTGDCGPSVLGMNCCSSAASSEISIDQTSTPTNSTTKVNDLTASYNGYDNNDASYSRCKRVDIEFENVKYTVRKFSFAETKFVTKEILHGINGAFRSGELTAIMGPSGSGKSTLLNVMTGFSSTGVSGKIRVNGKTISTNSQKFRELSCYIHQDDLLRPQLSVGETMMLAAHLKLGFKISTQKKLSLVKHILSQLGLEHRFNVYTAKLSGGQKKRLAIALELISNPPVLYLDEPTTGLDSSSCSQCISLLKKLASQGHTIVCTIHQPSALIFEMFDKLYTVVEGHCMYQGPVRELVPFLADQNLLCPSYHNPADFLLEVAVGDYERDLEKLINAANKKYFEDSDLNQVTRLISKMTVDNVELTSQLTTNGNKLAKTFNATASAATAAFSQFPTFDYVKPVVDELALEETKALKTATDINMGDNTHHLQTQQQQQQNQQHELQQQQQQRKQSETATFSKSDRDNISQASFFMQYILLLKRILVCSRRNYFLLMARLLSHLFIGVVFGYLYRNVGEKATTVLGNYVYLYGSILLLVYTGKMAVVLTFPLEIGMLSREHFNRWYNLGPYFLSLLSFEIPFQSLCAVLYTSISIFLTHNDNEERFRVYYFVIFAILATLCAQAWGFFVGATMPIKLAVFLGPILAVMFSIFGFCTRYIDITPMFRWMWHISYFRAGFHGALNAIYGMERPFLPCPANTMYCHFRSPKVFLNYMMISDVNMADCIIMMVTVIGVMHILTIIRIWHKLNKR